MGVTQKEIFVYLDKLRESGETNMFGAGVYLEREFNLSRKHARKNLMEWMKTFGDRHPSNKIPKS